MSTPNTTAAPTPSSPEATQATAKPEAGVAPEAAKPVEQVKPPTAAEIRRLKLKLDGSDIELPEEEVIKLAQKAGAADKRFQDAAAEKKRAVEVLEFLKANPKEALKRLGVDLRKFSEDTLTEIIKQEQESPEAKKARELEEKIRAYEAKEKEEQERKEKERLDNEKRKMDEEKQRKQAEIIKKYDEMFTSALAKADVPKSAHSVARMAQLQQINLKKGYQLDADQLAKIVSEDYQKEVQTYLKRMTADGKLDGEKILALLGEEIDKATTQAKIAKLKSAKQQKFAQPSAAQPQSQSQEQPSQRTGSWRDFAKKNRNAWGRG